MTVKMITGNITALTMMMLFLSVMTSLANTTGNLTEVAEVGTNKTDNGTKNTGDDSGGMSTELKACLFIAGILTVLAVIGCFYIKQKADSSGYASGNNIPKTLAGISDDF